MRRVIMLGFVLVGLAPVAALSQPAPAPPTGAANSLTSRELSSYCVFNHKVFSPGAILCAGEKRGFQCVAFREGTSAHWATDTSNSAPMNDGCKGPTPLN